MKNNYITKNDDYLKLFKDVPENKDSQANASKLSEAFKIALDTRKFEIDLYWKRATYFWAFIAASITAYFVVRTSNNVDQYKYLTVIISIIGYMFSLGWYMVNRGSKYWQENWERHVSNLEKEICGPLFANVKIPEKHHFWKPTKGFPFSVSKVNQLLSFFISLFWLGIFFYSLLFSYDKLEIVQTWLTVENTTYIFIFWIIAITVLTIVLIYLSRSFVVKDIDNLSKKQRKEWLFMSKKPKMEVNENE